MLMLVATAGVGSTMGAVAVFALIIIFFLKLYNVLRAGELYDIVIGFLIWIASIFCLLFVMLGLMADLTVIMSAYVNFSAVITSVITMLFIFEILIYLGKINFRDRIETPFSR